MFEVACSEVVLPRLRVDTERPLVADESSRLILRRGHTGAQELYRWWRAERDREPRRVRLVAVDALDEHREPVTRWEFTGCRIVALEYSPLDAVRSGVLIEAVEVEFDEVVQRPIGR